MIVVPVFRNRADDELVAAVIAEKALRRIRAERRRNEAELVEPEKQS